MDQQVKQWIDYAAQDLGVARHLFENYHPKPLEIICYRQFLYMSLRCPTVSARITSSLSWIRQIRR